MMTRRLLITLTALTTLLLCLAGACSDDEGDKICNADNHGDTWNDGPQCCAGGCGVGTDGFLPVICNGSKQTWECQGSGVPAESCASFRNACNTMDGCHVLGLGTEEPDPVPELCCFPSCKGTKVMKRTCKTGTLWECPGGAVPISRCKDYVNACGGILAKYKANNYKLPD